jgi:hypothetical protein
MNLRARNTQSNFPDVPPIPGRNQARRGMLLRNTAVLVCLGWLAGCTRDSERPLFKLLSPNQTGVTFANTVVTSDSLNFQTDAYVYNGAGVAVGDVDNDGLPDIFFTGNMVSSRLYLNKGGMRFEDITLRARLTTDRWATGATMVDINNDGFLDIYVSVSGPQWTKAEQRANLLFINNGDRTFTEAAAKYGVADTGFTTSAAFLDYNGDGCLDLFLLNNSAKDFTRTDLSTHPSGRMGETPGSHNELYRNDCNGTFSNASRLAGILQDAGFGLGVGVDDLNRDGWPDIYVSNDIAPNDVVYVNNGNGTFTNKRAVWLKHSSYSGMGVDIADFNNDGWPDILQVDMLPRDLTQRKRMSGATTLSGLLEARRRGFLDDYTANALQLNNGRTKEVDVIFSDIAHLAGVAATDWSWSPLFADFDNDGYKDILITNGYPKAVNDRDYVMPPTAGGRAAGTSGSRRAPLEMLNRLYAYHVSNYVFRNAGDLTFTNETQAWGIDAPSFSYGAAYVDLDNDGRLDLVVNNMNAPAFIYQNIQPKDDAHHYLSVRLAGTAPNTRAVGSRLIVTVGGQKQYIYQSPYRGYMSTVDDRAHFGLGRARRVDSLEIEWPDGRYQLLTNLNVDRLVIVKQSDAKSQQRAEVPATKSPTRGHWFQRLDLRGLKYKQPSPMQIDFSVQPLLPYLPSSRGPALAIADANGDGLDDVFIGGGGGVSGKLFVQHKGGGFVESTVGQPWQADKDYDDWGASFFDANGDGRPDLYVASGGYQLTPSSPLLQDRLYINQGGGRFERDNRALPSTAASKSVVRVGDFNGDGRPDLFVGGRLTPRNYPYPTRSYVLRNDGGRFTDVTEEMAPELIHPGGMITDAVWIDFDGDGRLDLVTAGEWMPIHFYRNHGKGLRDVTRNTTLPPMRGWWYSLAVGDFDGDGRPDLVAGNLGSNFTYTTSRESRFGVYAGDFTGNRTTDIVLTQEVRGTEYPLNGLAPLGSQIYTLGLRFPTYGSFAQASVKELFTDAQLRQSLHYQADTFASVYLHNDGGGKFTSSPLPNLAQIAPIKAIISHDVDGDGHLDLIEAGNLYDVEPNTPRADAGNGLWLRGDGHGHFIPVSPGESGFVAPLNVAGLSLIKTIAGTAVLVANTGDSLQVFRVRKP